MTVNNTLVSICMSCMVLAASGCASTEPVRNVSAAPVYRNWGELTLQNVRDTIVAGLVNEKWNVVDEDQGWLIAMREDGSQWAKIRITFTTRSFDIIHFESVGFQFDGSRIDDDYNDWIEDVLESINDAFAEKPSEKSPP